MTVLSSMITCTFIPRTFVPPAGGGGGGGGGAGERPGEAGRGGPRGQTDAGKMQTCSRTHALGRRCITLNSLLAAKASQDVHDELADDESHACVGAVATLTWDRIFQTTSMSRWLWPQDKMTICVCNHDTLMKMQ